MTHPNQPTSPLRQRMINDMTLRKFTAKTQAGYLRAVLRFTRFSAVPPIWLRPRICAHSNCSWSRKAPPAPPSTPPLLA